MLSHEEVEPTVAISEDTATVMNKLLQNVVYGSNGTGRGAAGYISNMKIYSIKGYRVLILKKNVGLQVLRKVIAEYPFMKLSIAVI